ncbi:MAG TPA: hypothetical protein VK582_07080 [Pyrinomonadaceae bacterium]|nr:hypothetical protein [Pyrinomonadaceae bacterium]
MKFVSLPLTLAHDLTIVGYQHGQDEQGAGEHVIAFLASEAASFIVGETIEVNGGQLML